MRGEVLFPMALRGRIRVPRTIRRWSAWCQRKNVGRGIACYLLLTPLLAVLAQLLTLAFAECLVMGASIVRVALLPHLPLDPVYASAAIYLVGDIDPHGIAVNGALGHFLHAWWPGVFASELLVAPGAI